MTLLRRLIIRYSRLRRLQRAGLIVCVVAWLCLLAITAIPLPNPLFPDDYSRVVTDRHGGILRVFLNGKEQWHLPPDPTARIPEILKQSVLAREDRRFRFHPGIDPLAVIRALRQNAGRGGIVSGASTITMQVARMARPKARTFGNKISEALQALKIDLLWSKDEILTLYLDHAPYGRNIVGYRTASWRYFRKRPDQLSWSEAALLAVLPNAPGLIAPGINQSRLVAKRNHLLALLLENGDIDRDTYRLSLAEPIPDYDHPFPLAAAHAAEYAVSAYPNTPLLNTTIDADIQAGAEKVAGVNAHRLAAFGIRNLAMLVVHNPRGEIRAWVGSQSYFDVRNQGMINGVIAPRSSGSILKPFLYVLSIQNGTILPETLLEDTPADFSGFVPTNASGEYDGVVPAGDALVRSLNVPAVRLLSQLGVPVFHRFLRDAGFRTLFRRPDEYGLTLIIGGAEVTVIDLATACRGLAMGGRFGPLSLLMEPEENPATPVTLLDEGACWLTLKMLQDLRRPGAELFWNRFESRRPVSWKTGTSYGGRDGWAAGMTPEWTVVVWVGNFDGESNPNLFGESCAGPLLFDMLALLPRQGNGDFARPSKALHKVSLCNETGYTPSDACPETAFADAPIAAPPLPTCPYHRRIQVSDDECFEVCSACWESGRHHAISALVFPPDVTWVLRERGLPQKPVPPHNPRCPNLSEAQPARIVYPENGSRVWIPREIGGITQSLVARVAHRNASGRVFWYLDGVYLGETTAHHTMGLILTPGPHELEIVDSDGFRDKRRFTAVKPN